MPTVTVPGQGEVEFPDSMSDAQIVAAIQKLPGIEPQGFWARAMSREQPPIRDGTMFGALRSAGDWLGEKQAAADQRIQREHPDAAPHLQLLERMGMMALAGGAAPRGAAGVELPKMTADPVAEQIARVNAATPAAQISGGLPKIPGSGVLGHLPVVGGPVRAYEWLRGLTGREMPVAPKGNPYPTGVAPPADMPLPMQPFSMSGTPGAQPITPPARPAPTGWPAQAAPMAAPSAAPPATAEATPPAAVAPPVPAPVAPAEINPFEAAARSGKVSALVKAIDANASAHLGVDPLDPRVAEALGTLPPEWWEGMAKVAKIQKPSPTTIDQTSAFFRDRAAQAGRAAAAQSSPLGAVTAH